MKVKKFLSALIAAVMLFSTMSLVAFAESDYVAQIGETQYESLDAALAEAKEGDMIQLTAEVILEDDIAIAQGVTLSTNGLLDAGGHKISLVNGALVLTSMGDDSLNSVLTAGDYLPEYTEDGTERIYRVSDVLFDSPEIFMAGHETVITSQSGEDTDTNLFLTYTAEDGKEYVALYNNTTAARIFGGWKNPSADQREVATSLTINSGLVDSLRGGSKDKTCTTIEKATIVVNGGTIGIVASGWYYNQSVREFNVEVNGGTITTVYGNGETAYIASTEMAQQEGFVPTVDTANITVNDGNITYLYGSGRALTQSNTSANYSMLTKNVNININGGTVGYVNGGGFSGPEAHWGPDSGQDVVTVETAVITVSGGTIGNLYSGGYNGQWQWTYKLNAEGELVFSNYNGTDETTRSVRNIVEDSTIYVTEGASITNLYMGGRSYAMTQQATVYMDGGSVETFSTSGSYGYTVNADANISGGAIETLELVHRNYVGDIDLDVTETAAVGAFYAGVGGANKNANLNEAAYNISTIAILGSVDINFEDGTLKGESYLTTGLERAAAVTANVPLTVHTMDLVGGGDYTGSITTSGKFAVVNETADWDAIVILSSENESFSSTDEDFVCASGDADMVATKDDNGVYTLTNTSEIPVAQIGGAYYPTLSDAYASAVDGSTIQLLAETEEAITISKEITIALNGFAPLLSVGEGYTRASSAEGQYVVVANDSVASAIDVAFEKVSDNLYNIVLIANGDTTINRLTSADLTFALDSKAVSYEILPYGDIRITMDPAKPDRYLFYFDSASVDATDSEIVIGQVQFNGYGSLVFSVAGDTNAVHATSIADNLVTDFIPDGAVDSDEKTGQLNLNEEVANGKGTIAITIGIPTNTLTVNVTFPNNIQDNAAIYQDMKATISGGDLPADIVINFGTDEGENIVALNENTYSFARELTENTMYQVTISGAGYRTYRQNVRMTDDVQMNIWNNVKDTAAEVMTGVTATKTFLAGDIIMDHTINIYDLSAVVSYFGQEGIDVTQYSEYARYDLNRDGKIDSKDVAMVLVSWDN